jgi:hypothetical protein
MSGRGRRIPIGIPILLQQSHRDKSIQEQSQGLSMDAETTSHIVEGFPLPIQSRKYIQPDSREQDFGLPVVPKLEDFCEREFS